MTDPVKGGCNGTIEEFGWSGKLGTRMLIDRKEDLTACVYAANVPAYGGIPYPRDKKCHIRVNLTL